MTRDTIKNEILALKGRHFIFELATGTGKSWLTLIKIKDIYTLKSLYKDNCLLIVVPKNVLKDTWATEIKKWWPECPLKITYTTYNSLHKYKQYWDFIIFDECHHISERCMNIIKNMSYRYVFLCSATISYNKKIELTTLFHPITVYKKDLRSVINAEILPDPQIILIPLQLDTQYCKEEVKVAHTHILTTEKDAYAHMSKDIEYYKRKYMSTNKEFCKHLWLHFAGERLKWLSDKKLHYISEIFKQVADERTITFCNTIAQTQLLGKYCINSKNKEAAQYLKDFNEGKVDHITCCNMLNEGVNITNCRIGIFCNLNASELITKQRIGRILRHPEPILIIPYFQGTREEELVEKLLTNCNSDLVKYTTYNNIVI